MQICSNSSFTLQISDPYNIKVHLYSIIGVPLYCRLMYFNYKRKEFPQRKHTYVCSQSRRNPGYVSLFHT